MYNQSSINAIRGKNYMQEHNIIQYILYIGGIA